MREVKELREMRRKERGRRGMEEKGGEGKGERKDVQR
jgi:hypothetical protein